MLIEFAVPFLSSNSRHSSTHRASKKRPKTIAASSRSARIFVLRHAAPALCTALRGVVCASFRSAAVAESFDQSAAALAEDPNMVRVLVTGAAGQIGYSIVLQIAKGDVFGKDVPVELVLLDIPMMENALTGVKAELIDCAIPHLKTIITATTEAEGFQGVDYAFLVGAMPRREGMERKDLLAANVKIFKSQGKALADYANPDCKILVVGNPANTNALICAKYAAGKIPLKNFSAMTRLDHNRATAQIALKAGVGCGDVKNVIIWGNHSSTQFPDAKHAKVTKGGNEIDAYSAVNDTPFLQGPFISTVQKRGAEIIALRKLSSAMSAAKAACDHMHDWYHGTKPGQWVSMAIPSDGSYGIPEGLIFSFPVTVDGQTKEWKIVQGLNLDDFAKEKIAVTTKELEEERAEALSACEEASLMALSPLVIYLNFGVQFLCSLIIAILNPLILFSRLSHTKGNSQLTMIFIHIGFHFVFAMCTFIYTGSVLAYFRDDTKRDLIFWTALVYGSILTTTALSDLFLSLDRYLAIRYPVKYLMSLKTKLVLYSSFFSCAFCISIAPISAMHRVDTVAQPLMLTDFVDRRAISFILTTSVVLMVLNIIISAAFLIQLRKFNNSLIGIRKSIKLANTTVAYQITLAGIFWVIPSVGRTLMEMLFDIYPRKTMGPLTITLVVVYMACCSVLYWKKLIPSKTEPSDSM
ncbi:hypothetical protein QR680_013941 [Steinernema hermaphroditum]|uniref:Malate dehydrogenase, cytoplasmic n=1 Tax=Steinernema hermaphroditum TaxID=289476 RepID=A0AA39M3C7_9BILA|nr:hypothetical protein QR680_013941 [Steinernema hermaphroditum]